MKNKKISVYLISFFILFELVQITRFTIFARDKSILSEKEKKDNYISSFVLLNENEKQKKITELFNHYKYNINAYKQAAILWKECKKQNKENCNLIKNIAYKHYIKYYTYNLDIKYYSFFNYFVLMPEIKNISNQYKINFEKLYT